MSTLIEVIKKDRIEAIKSKSEVKKSLLTVVMSDAQMLAKEAKMEAPTDEQIVTILKKHKKGVDENLSLTKDDVIKRVKFEEELVIIDSYLPKQIGDEQLIDIVKQFVSTLTPEQKTPKAISLIMGHLKINYGGQYDGRKASEVAKSLL